MKKFLLVAVLATLSFQSYAASMNIRSGQFGLKFENTTGDKELEITNLRPVVTCSTSYTTIFGNLDVASNTKEPKSIHYPDSLHVGTSGMSYIQLNISGQEQVSAPPRLFDREKYCEFSIVFNALVADDRTGDQVSTGTVQATLLKTDRDDVNVLDELNSLKVMKFKVQTSADGRVEFALDKVGVFPLN